MATRADEQLPSHGFPEKLRLGKNSVAQWATDPDGRLVVFVHGFGGDATGTWKNMQTMLPSDPRYGGVDIVFYGYESTRSRVAVHANRFLDFLEDLLGRKQYSKIVLAAHSLGAVVVRRAIIVAFTQHRAWASRTKAVLFGPAHRGASIQALIAETSGVSFLPFLYSLVRYEIPVLQDLHPTDSQFLTELRQEYADHMPEPASAPLLARSIFGDRDTVVELLDFHPDERLETWPNQGHISVCKPNSGYLDPIDAVADALND